MNEINKILGVLIVSVAGYFLFSRVTSSGDPMEIMAAGLWLAACLWVALRSLYHPLRRQLEWTAVFLVIEVAVFLMAKIAQSFID